MIYWRHYKFDNLTGTKTKYQKRYWADDIICFDTETSSAYLRDGILVHPSEWEKKRDTDIPVALCYIWQININGSVLYGRDLKELPHFLNALYEHIGCNFIVYIHNASFEFTFLCNLFRWTKIFARAPHRVVYFENEYCQFRCSYMLTRLSLAAWGVQIGGTQKAVGDLDYSVWRTPLTAMNAVEMGYCENDVIVMYEGLQQYVRRYGHICNIPLTQTGEVRRKVKELFVNDYKWLKRMTSMLPANEEQYRTWKELTWGGLTHANIFKVGRLLEHLKSRDITSSYPFNLCCQKFPMSAPVKMPLSKMDKFMSDDDYLCYFKIECTDINTKYQNHYLSASKNLTIIGEVVENGRVISADYVQLWCTDLDYLNIADGYAGKIEIQEMWVMKADYLPKKFVEFILELFQNKTILDGVDGKEDLYMQSKQFINSIGGMMLTDLIQDTIVYKDGKWERETPDVNTVLKDKKEKWYNNTLSYLHGVWMLAYARNNLWSSIRALDEDVAYYDTDSNKYEGEHEEWFEEYNRQAWIKLCTALVHHGIPIEKGRAVTPKGKIKTLGEFKLEGVYEEFKTLGAKRYCYKEDGKLHLTCSGLNPKAAVKKFNRVDDFKDNTLFEYEYCKRLLLHYNTDQPRVTWNVGQYDEYVSDYKYGICGANSQYNLSMNGDFKDMIMIMVGGIF